MSLIRIAWRNFRHRTLSSFLTTLSLALGVGLVVLVLSIYGIISEAFLRNASVGPNLVVGAAGSGLQLTLNSIFYLSQPIENLDYTDYLDFLSKQRREEEVIRCGGNPAIGEQDGQYFEMLKGREEDGYVVPLALGDYYGEFRLVGTTPDFFEKLRHGPLVDQKFTFSEGRPFETFTPENGYFEAVLGSRVAKQRGVKVGDVIYPAHGDPNGKTHSEGFTVVGIVSPTGTPNDRAAFINLEGFYLMEGHSKPVDEVEDYEPVEAMEVTGDWPKPLSIPEREITALLVRTGNIGVAVVMQNMINETKTRQAVAPIGEINRLMDAIVGPLLTALMIITLLTCIVAAVGVLVAIYNSMNDRRKDIAVMRALGARRGTVTSIILMESLLIALIGGCLGWLAAHGAIWISGDMIEDQTGIQIGFFSTSNYEIMVLPLVLALALLAGLLPAWSAYRTDVGSNLAS